MVVLKQILSEIGLEEPDRRPLYALPLSNERQTRLQADLRRRLCFHVCSKDTAARFVLWAAEHIRTHFGGGQLTWKFVFDGLDQPEDRDLAVQFVKDGLRWWGRDVRVSEKGLHLYLYTLMAEGGLPQALLVQTGLYHRTVMGLLADLEAEDVNIPNDLALRIAGRRAKDLPQTFHTDDIVRLLADLALALASLRNQIPGDVPPELTDLWLDKNCPDWRLALPLRLSKEVSDQLIRPALRMEQRVLPLAKPLAWRALVRDEAGGGWQAVIRIAEEGVLAAKLLPQAEGLRLRFLPSGVASEKAGSMIYSAIPEDGGWMLRRLGRTGTVTVSLALDAPLILSGFADGRMLGEVEIVSPLPSLEEAPSLWRAEGASGDGDMPGGLLPFAGSGKTCASRIWLLTEAGKEPITSDGLIISEPQRAAGGSLWSLSGTGEVRLGEFRWRISTGANEDAAEASLLTQGDILPSWRQASNGGHVFLGAPALMGLRQTGVFRLLRSNEIRKRPARSFMGEIAEWIEDEAILARLRYVALPKGARLDLRETRPGTVELRAEGLTPGLSLTLLAGQVKVRDCLTKGSGKLVLSVTEAPPGIVALRMTFPEAGAPLELVAPWPARSGMILSPDNLRLERDTPLSIGELRGWRAVSPGNVSGDVQFRLDRRFAVTVRAAGEVPLVAHMPLIRAMLAHAGPDAQVGLNLITEGQEGRRLEIRRYHGQADVDQNGELRLGLARDRRTGKETAKSIENTYATAVLHAVNLKAPEQVRLLETDVGGPINLPSWLPEGGAFWLIQAMLDGRPQRAFVWSLPPTLHPSQDGHAPQLQNAANDGAGRSTREDRIAKYAAKWATLLNEPENPSWEHQWKTILAVGQGGDAGVLDQVQALAKTPAAAAALLFRVPLAELAQCLALDMAAPIFWPATPVKAFSEALLCEQSRLIGRYLRVLEDQREAENEAIFALIRRFNAILALLPELAGHLGAALFDAGFLSSLMREEKGQALLKVVLVGAPETQLEKYAQDAARRFDWLPSGVRGEEPHARPPGFSFGHHCQPVIDAPLVTAEIATGLRPPPDTKLMLRLINLRLVDPLYFDSALPAALAFVRKKARS